MARKMKKIFLSSLKSVILKFVDHFLVYPDHRCWIIAQKLIQVTDHESPSKKMIRLCIKKVQNMIRGSFLADHTHSWFIILEISWFESLLICYPLLIWWKLCFITKSQPYLWVMFSILIRGCCKTPLSFSVSFKAILLDLGTRTVKIVFSTFSNKFWVDCPNKFGNVNSFSFHHHLIQKMVLSHLAISCIWIYVITKY